MKSQAIENPEHKRGPIYSAAAILAAMLLATAGCGSSVYGDKFEKRLRQVDAASAFAVLAPKPGTFAETGLHLNFRIPKGVAGGQAFFTGEPLKLIRPIELPKFPVQWMYKCQIADPNLKFNTYPLTLYIKDAPIAKWPATAYDTWKADFRSKIKGSKVSNWEDCTDVKTNTGASVLHWKKIVVDGKMSTNVTQNGGVNPNTEVETHFEMWVYESPDEPRYVAVLGWQWPTLIGSTPLVPGSPLTIADLPRLTAGTVVFTPPMAK